MSIRAFDQLIEQTIQAMGEISGFHPHTRGRIYNLLLKFGEEYAKLSHEHALKNVSIKAGFDPAFIAQLRGEPRRMVSLEEGENTDDE